MKHHEIIYLQAQNIMLWHVPNGKKAYEISDSAFLKYYTTSGFLNNSHLQNLYKNKFPLKTAGKLKMY